MNDFVDSQLSIGPGNESEAESAASLESLREEILAGAAESRRSTRRVFEGLKNLGGVLDATSAMIRDLHTAERTAAEPRPSSGDDRALLLGIVELFDRIERVSTAVERRPEASSVWPGARKALAQWNSDRDRIDDAISILSTHTEALLNRAGLERVKTEGKPFDPLSMTAVEAVRDDSAPDHTVLAELLPGWHIAASGEILRPAQVRVSRRASF